MYRVAKLRMRGIVFGKVSNIKIGYRPPNQNTECFNILANILTQATAKTHKTDKMW